MIGVIVNTVAVIIGSIVGLLFKKGISKKVTDAVMVGIGLCTVYIGISGTLKGKNTLILIISIVIGTIIGTWIDIDKRINALGEWIGKRFRASSDNSISVAEGFVTASLLFCIGAMTIVGSLNAGLIGDNTMLFTKSVLDLISSTILSVSLGIGVLFSASFVFIFQGAIVLLAQFLQPILTNSAIGEITCTGSLMIIALGLNIIGVTKIKVANYLPAIIVTPILCWIVTLI
ncbi:DUF554 domain-containing protein [Clostridium sp. MT-14]|jgi:uncharacterized membrane protein YqgA involved in biofilm formation|uniref:DUF554 domain-containing protein n=1 Tax=Clostridium aromativorans TaxID=2836848 RepID=A0ABS8N3J1_9CLOT|nr:MULTISPECIES: DUF554 domain-containing protein [Clostridium]KAA8672021.1 DUF554 domain-containing protein [Clostridium sp. HV4-5-A1G]MCC9294353.1 DUF554 domain-containing protein [Clostridium aromativorans]CAB1262397.1 Putative membrane protein YdfK [Clostridiaceae bacterium BL-3]